MNIDSLEETDVAAAFQALEEMKRACDYLASGRHFISHPCPLPTLAEIRGMIGALELLLARFDSSRPSVRLFDPAKVELSIPVFLQFVGAQCLAVFETEVNAALASTLRIPEWNGILKEFSDAKHFHLVLNRKTKTRSYSFSLPPSLNFIFFSHMFAFFICRPIA